MDDLGLEALALLLQEEANFGEGLEAAALENNHGLEEVRLENSAEAYLHVDLVEGVRVDLVACDQVVRL